MVEFISILVTVIIFILSSLPLYFAVKLLGGNTNLLKTALVALIAGIVVAVIESFFSIWGGLIAFMLLLFIYKGMFGIGWLRAFLVWVIQLVIIVLISVLVGTLSLLGKGVSLIPKLFS